ncbi:hypothetical protein XH99_01585 [Bradyrhizobium nanningense]|uniref:Uncharacterized protein n=1 Tax=Bradyrhizobium nanningense TaxID=1325118 RepID=A0A4V1L3H5_9BRAD|nr:hypothetical protein XH99_01585 [Bradyrhizobium nanningense]
MGFGWTNSHLFEFLAGEGRRGKYAPLGAQFDPNVVASKMPEAAVSALSKIWKPRRRGTRLK